MGYNKRYFGGRKRFSRQRRPKGPIAQQAQAYRSSVSMRYRMRNYGRGSTFHVLT